MRVVRQKQFTQQQHDYAVLAAGMTSGVWSGDAEAATRQKPEKKEEPVFN